MEAVGTYLPNHTILHLDTHCREKFKHHTQFHSFSLGTERAREPWELRNKLKNDYRNEHKLKAWTRKIKQNYWSCLLQYILSEQQYVYNSKWKEWLYKRRTTLKTAWRTTNTRIHEVRTCSKANGKSKSEGLQLPSTRKRNAARHIHN
jgi:hypothetical protein